MRPTPTAEAAGYAPVVRPTPAADAAGNVPVVRPTPTADAAGNVPDLNPAIAASVTAGSARAVCAMDTAAGAIGVVSSRSVYSSDSTIARASCAALPRRRQIRQRVQLVPQRHQHRDRSA